LVKLSVILFAQELGLVRQRYFHGAAAIKQQALAAEARVEPWINSAVDEILLFIAQFFQEILALIHIQVAGAAGADTTAVVVQVNVVHEGHFQKAVAWLYIFQRYRLEAGLLKIEFNGIHQ
jgi:hypothetical protein